MSKAMTAVCAFIAGFCLAFLLNTSSPSVTASAPVSQASVSDSHRSVFHGGGAFGGGMGVVIEPAIPRFAPLETTPIFEDFTIANTRQPLDGLDCRNCTFDNVALQYSGGPYNLVNAHFSGTTSLVLTGAAANTAAFLGLLSGVSRGIPLASPPQNKPVRRKATAKNPPQKIDFTAPFIGSTPK